MTETTASRMPPPTPMPKAVLCPYCGTVTRNVQRCESCSGYLDALSRQATQNGMGPWQVHNASRPFSPGCSYEILGKLIDAGKVGEHTVLRGPTTGQFWMLARRVPGVSHLVGWCHSCQAPAKKDDYACKSCGAVFQGDRDRQHLGLGPIRPLPGEGSAELVAARAAYTLPAVPTPTPGAARGADGRPAPATPRPPADAARLRTLERRVVLLRSRVMMAVGVIIVLVCALAAALALLTIEKPEPGPPTGARPLIEDPAYLGPGLVPFGEDDDDAGAGAAEDAPAPADELPPPEPEAFEEPVPERPFDITLLSWPDAALHLETTVDPASAESLAAGVALLEQYDAAVGLPDAGRELLDTWTFRLEQLRLNGIP